MDEKTTFGESLRHVRHQPSPILNSLCRRIRNPVKNILVASRWDGNRIPVDMKFRAQPFRVNRWQKKQKFNLKILFHMCFRVPSSCFAHMLKKRLTKKRIELICTQCTQRVMCLFIVFAGTCVTSHDEVRTNNRLEKRHHCGASSRLASKYVAHLLVMAEMVWNENLNLPHSHTLK